LQGTAYSADVVGNTNQMCHDTTSAQSKQQQ